MLAQVLYCLLFNDAMHKTQYIPKDTKEPVEPRVQGRRDLGTSGYGEIFKETQISHCTKFAYFLCHARGAVPFQVNLFVRNSS